MTHTTAEHPTCLSKVVIVDFPQARAVGCERVGTWTLFSIGETAIDKRLLRVRHSILPINLTVCIQASRGDKVTVSDVIYEASSMQRGMTTACRIQQHTNATKA